MVFTHIKIMLIDGAVRYRAAKGNCSLDKVWKVYGRIYHNLDWRLSPS
ncbi:hypothetical protein APHWI1_0934 [Anaplasma phagocytophilum str. ApWI1]|uniref:Uncharacterized protein n=1 Tax=Anaplasma phagocytophilum str. ApWI1 TaxID=1359155 RepID=A0A0F3PXV6_ANAPH|nr:hypothetical protein APHHGE2_0165 [Anaplasma phagocytophilum str. HGE2]KJV84822.1 hypothetical protein APHWI1_0934 [Anaplasma phagocytophilum str. ApWI1]KKA00488.1 hypothetical protein APHDU1_0699 [Anaplasma phagocytophilum]